MSDKPVIVIDLPGLLLNEIGEHLPDEPSSVRPGARDFLKALCDRGFSVHVWTSMSEDLVVKWLELHGLDRYVEAAHSGKAPGSILLDPRAVYFDGQWGHALGMLDGVKPYWEIPTEQPLTSGRPAFVKPKLDSPIALGLRLRQTEERVATDLITRLVVRAKDAEWEQDRIDELITLLDSWFQEREWHLLDIAKAENEELRSLVREAGQRLGQITAGQVSMLKELQTYRKELPEMKRALAEAEAKLDAANATVDLMRDQAAKRRAGSPPGEPDANHQPDELPDVIGGEMEEESEG